MDGKYLTVLITDTHFGTHNNSMMWLRSQLDFFDNQFIPYLIKKKEDHYKIRVIHCGDVFDSRSTINTYIATQLVKRFDRCACIVDKFVIVNGNHDFFNPSHDDVDTIELIFKQLKMKYPIFQIVSKTNMYDEWGEEKCVYVPWYEWLDQDGLKEYLKKCKTKPSHIFTHADLVMEKTDIDCPNIITGHVHTPYFHNNIKNLGSTYALTFADCNSERGFYEYEDGGELKFIENQYSIRFWRFRDDEVLEIPENIQPNDQIELYISKSSLIKKKYMKACDEWFKKFKNITLIPQPDGTSSIKDIKQFEGYNIEKMTENMIPEELKDKFERVKQYINSIKD